LVLDHVGHRSEKAVGTVAINMDMDCATIGAVDIILCKGGVTGRGQNTLFTYYMHITKSILDMFTQWGISPDRDVWFRPAWILQAYGWR